MSAHKLYSGVSVQILLQKGVAKNIKLLFNLRIKSLCDKNEYNIFNVFMKHISIWEMQLH